MKWLLILFVVSTVHAESFSTFKAGRFYKADGRWIEFQNKTYFKVNDNNANIELIEFSKSPKEMAAQIKYTACFKVKANCHLECIGEWIKPIVQLRPWDEMRALAANSDGSYPDVQEKECK